MGRTSDLIKFWQTLFDADDYTCFTSTPHGTLVYPALTPADPQPNYFTINALDSRRSRSDAAVVKHRTFLFEFDTMPMDMQLTLLANFPLPLTAAVFSGNKSIHFFITTQELLTPEQYADMWKRMANCLPEGVDKSTKNPSRLARAPYAIRDGKVQTLYTVNNRVRLVDLEVRCAPLVEHTPKSDNAPASGTTVFQRIALMEAKEQPEVVMQNLGLAGRNALFFWLGNRMRDDNMPRAAQVRYVEAVYAALRDKKDFTWNEAKAAARI